MRIVKITSFYSQFLNYYYAKFPDIVNAAYPEQYSHLMSQKFAWADFFKKNFEEQGHEAFEIIWNAKPLQDSWSEYFAAGAKENILLSQLKHYKPEMIIFQDSVSFSSELILEIRQQVKSVKVIIGFLCSPFNDLVLDNLKAYDFVLACPPFIKTLTEKGIKCHKFIHAFEESILNEINKDNNFSPSDFFFAGSLFGGKNFHSDRILMLEKLIRNKINMKIYSPPVEVETALMFLLRKFSYYSFLASETIGLSGLMKKLPRFNKIALMSEPPERVRISKQLRSGLITDPLFGLDMYKALSKSRIGFNFHGGIAGDFAANVRLFEVTGVGSLLLTDHKKNIAELFEPDREIVTYKSSDECVEKVNYLLSHPAVIQNIARAGQKRCLKHHSIKIRTEEIVSLTENYLRTK